ncbi:MULTISPECIES: helix-turn-helix domain-containing protein [unclassified Streptomyces]|uniref:helix-turn-helix domain-containing protein n=1 Tax=unclassified Streptomyces TaxID=2593676 RepID=UPI00383068DF
MVLLRTDLLMESATAAGHTTIGEIAEAVGVSASTMQRLIKGDTSPSASTLVALRKQYGISLDNLVREPEMKKRKPGAKAEVPA